MLLPDTPTVDADDVSDESEGRELSGDANTNANAASGMWEESFDGHIDTKPHGPTSVGMDMWFPGSHQV